MSVADVVPEDAVRAVGGLAQFHDALEKLHPEDAQLKTVAGLDDVELRRLEQVVLVELDLDQPLGQLGPVQRRKIELRQEVGQPTDVVLMAVGEQPAALRGRSLKSC